MFAIMKDIWNWKKYCNRRILSGWSALSRIRTEFGKKRSPTFLDSGYIPNLIEVVNADVAVVGIVIRFTAVFRF